MRKRRRNSLWRMSETVGERRLFSMSRSSAAAHGDVGLGFAVEVGEFAAGAGAAVWVALDADGLEMAGPDVAGNEAAMERVRAAGQELHGFGGFERSD